MTEPHATPDATPHALDLDDTAEALAARTLELVDIASESRHEADLCAHVDAMLRAAGRRTHRIGDSLVTVPDDTAAAAAGTGRRRPRILFVGHLDTVPAQDNRPGRRDPDTGDVIGLGAADMKGALAVMLDLAAWAAPGSAVADSLTCDAEFLFYACEEIALAESGLTPLLDELTWLRDVDLAIVMEPTAGALQQGCLGNLSAIAHFDGVSCHSARPWLGANAVHRAIDVLGAVAQRGIVDDEIDGLTYREVVNVTMIEGGHAPNVIPDFTRAHLNFRYSPRRSPDDAAAVLAELCTGADRLEIRSNSPGALPAATNPLAERLRELGNCAVEPKQAWTDVAQFAAIGVPALNYGPGDPIHAHSRDERISVRALADCAALLRRFLTDEADT